MEDDGEYKHKVDSIAHSDNIIKHRAVWDTKVWVEVGEHIIKSGFTKEEEAKEACCNVDSRAEHQWCLYNGLDLGGVFKFIVYGVNCRVIKFFTLTY